MQLQIKPHSTNNYPFGGFLIKGKELENWLRQLQKLEIDLEQTAVYAIPGTTANSIWGCFALCSEEKLKGRLTSQQPCQSIHNRLFIPEYATISPLISEIESEKLFRKCPHIMHPEFGLFALDSPIEWAELLYKHEANFIDVTMPEDAVFIPETIKKMEIKMLSPEELLQAMEENIFPQKDTFKDEPLNWKEKIKLTMLRSLFQKNPEDSANNNMQKNQPRKWLSKIFPKKWVNNLEKDLEDLERRNSSELEKLMELFKKNPEEALKYAIPLDSEGTSRGGSMGSFSMTKRWGDLSLFGSQPTNSGDGNVVFTPDTFQRLQEQYTQSAEKYIKEKNYEKAAFVYMKLLNNKTKAAQTLEEGRLYPEAASVYLKYLQNKPKAAECYEKGQMTTAAIQIYKELKEYEKVGDLFLRLNQKREAFEYYNILIDEHKTANKYVKASLLYRYKMEDTTSAQDILLEGWREKKDAFNCLNNYFQNIQDKKILANEIEQIYLNETSHSQKADFLRVLVHEHKKDKAVEKITQKIAYEIVAELADLNPDIVAELKNFSNDHALAKDISRFKGKKTKL